MSTHLSSPGNEAELAQALALKIRTILFDVGNLPATKGQWLASIRQLCERASDDNVDLCVFPSMFSLGFGSYFAHRPVVQLQRIAEVWWFDFVPRLAETLRNSKAVLVLGSAPFPAAAPGGGQKSHFVERCAIVSDGAVAFQDRLMVSPEESFFVAGDTITLLRSNAGVTFAVAFGTDLADLKPLVPRLVREHVDLLICPTRAADEPTMRAVLDAARARAQDALVPVLVAPLAGCIETAPLGNRTCSAFAFRYPDGRPRFKEAVPSETTTSLVICDALREDAQLRQDYALRRHQTIDVVCDVALARKIREAAREDLPDGEPESSERASGTLRITRAAV